MSDTPRTLQEQEKKPQFFVEQCDACQGSGKTGAHICKKCKGFGMVGWFGGAALYWGAYFDTKSVLTREMTQGFFWLVQIVLMLVVLYGIINTLLNFQILWSSRLLSPDVWLLDEMWPAWLAVVALSFLYFRFSLHKRSAHVLSLFEKRKTKPFDVSAAFSREAWTAMARAWRIAEETGAREVHPLHIMLSLLEFSSVRAVFVRLGTPLSLMSGKVASYLVRTAKKREARDALQLHPKTKETLMKSFALAHKDRHQSIGLESLLRATVQESPEIADVFEEMAVDRASLRHVIQWFEIDKKLVARYKKFKWFSLLRPHSDMNRAMTAIATPFLDQFSRDLTRLATRGYITLCMGREREIDELLRVVEGGASGVVLVGPEGVGKTTIIGAIAERMIIGEVPKDLQDKRLLSLSIPKLMAGAGVSGILEKRLLRIRDEIMRAGNIILFVDNIHDLVGASGQGDVGLDISETLSRMIERDDFLVLATSNPLDFKKYIEGKSLGTVLQKVEISEPDADSTLSIMQSKVGFLEHKFKVYFSLGALQKIVTLSERYLHDQNMPEKALRIMEEVAVYVKNKRGERQLVTTEDVAALISEKTDIPLTKIGASESKTLLQLEDAIHQRIVNQEEAVAAVASALRRARTELRDEKRPIVNLLFLGPTGVGKTELAKTVAATYFGNNHELIRLDMSEYQNVSSIARLIGSEANPTGGYLTEAVRHNPFAVLLLDEIEKAHPDILNIFLQLMDDGRITDWSGKTIDFTNVILIATSNAGTAFIQEEVKKDTPLETIRETLIRDKIKDYFRPEFLNRFDRIVAFRPLTQEHIKRIAGLLIEKSKKRLGDRGIHLEVTDEALEELAYLGFDPLYGARPMRRVIQDRVDNALATYLLSGQIGRRDTAVLEKGGRIRVKKAARI